MVHLAWQVNPELHLKKCDARKTDLKQLILP